MAATAAVAATWRARHKYRMDHLAAPILAEIEAAFPARRAERFDPMVNSNQGDEPRLTAEAFADKDNWTELGSDWLDAVPDDLATALCFLSDEAACFYLPAFISADLRGELDRVDPVFHLTHGFDNFSRDQVIRGTPSETWTGYAQQRWSRLTSEQAQAIVHYLEWSITKDVTSISYRASEALSVYWYGRAIEV